MWCWRVGHGALLVHSALLHLSPRFICPDLCTVTQSPCSRPDRSFSSYSRFPFLVCRSPAPPSARCRLPCPLARSWSPARQQAGGAPATHAPFPQVWQHCDCMGVHADVEHYLCERCEPRPVDRVSRPLRPAAGALAPFDAALSPPPPQFLRTAWRGVGRGHSGATRGPLSPVPPAPRAQSSPCGPGL